MSRTCVHCDAFFSRPVDAYPDEPDYRMCPECADMAVLGGACPDCGEPPSGPCRDPETRRYYRGLEDERRKAVR